jgi:hypothetical protein
MESELVLEGVPDEIAEVLPAGARKGIVGTSPSRVSEGF